jgi:hypothetical protein
MRVVKEAGHGFVPWPVSDHYHLEAVAAATSATTTTATKAATASAAAAAAAATATAAAAAESTSAAAAAATATLFARLGFVHGQRSATMFLAVQGCNCSLCLGIGGHFHETKAFASAGVAVRDDLGALDGPMDRKEGLQCRAIHVVAQITNI